MPKDARKKSEQQGDLPPFVLEVVIDELEKWWDGQIFENPEDESIKVWKKGFIKDNKSGKRKTFFAWNGDEYIGQATLVFESQDKNLCGEGKANIEKLEVIEQYRGMGIASLIIKHLEEYARKKGIETLTIGVEPNEVKNMQIYFHWGYTTFIQCVTQTYPPKSKHEKCESITVLCYSKKLA